MMLAGIPAVGLAAILYFAARPVAGGRRRALIAFGGAVVLLARAYERRAG